MYFSGIIRRFAPIYNRQLMVKPNYLFNSPENASAAINAHASFSVDSISIITGSKHAF
jgi:hypothetical protein